jgi:site-specific DNA-methyltransferase (adenine-specific)
MNQLFFGDNLKVLRQEIKDESVDLIYLDPPFKSNQNYNVLFAEKMEHAQPRKSKPFRIHGAGIMLPLTLFSK